MVAGRASAFWLIHLSLHLDIILEAANFVHVSLHNILRPDQDNGSFYDQGLSRCDARGKLIYLGGIFFYELPVLLQGLVCVPGCQLRRFRSSAGR